jgi:predicted TIM-barrel fold metal-dependent hydrolase
MQVMTYNFVIAEMNPLGVCTRADKRDRRYCTSPTHPWLQFVRDVIPFSLPALCIPAANEYPDLKIVLAHSGGEIVSAEAQIATSICSNLYLETSWRLGGDIWWMISSIGSDRVMMGRSSQQCACRSRYIVPST